MGVGPNKACRLLCVVLVLTVCNWHLSLVSSEAESLDVKLRDRMSTCPVVKLRGLANSKNRPKKTRRLTLFEACIWLSVMIFNQVLRSLIAHITTLLLRAGDVELNPGPTPPASPTYRAETAARDTAQLANSSDTVANPTLPKYQLEAQQATPTSQDVQTQRKVVVPGLPIPAAMAQVAQSFQDQNVESPQSDGLTVEYPPPRLSYEFPTFEEREPQPGESVPVIFHPTKAKDDTDGYDDVGMHQPTTRDEAMSPPRQPHSMKRLSLQRTASPIAKPIAPEVRKQSRAQVLDQQKDVVRLVKLVLDKDEATAAAKRLLDFFVGANKLYRSGEKCPVCPICLKDKKDRGGQQKSHVIPKSILHHYWEIHSSSEQRDYILDFSRDERLAAGSLTYQLLCEKCETYYSKFEEYLLSLYLYLAAQEDTTKDIIVTHKDKNASSWLKYILANILFRGILTNIDLDERFQQQHIIDEIYFLWKFCSEKLEAASQQFTLPNLKVFLLPNKAFCSNLDDFMYPFEMLLRMPQCTELIQQKGEETFFYLKFDCFHIVLPLCEISKTYFETFNCGLASEDCNLCLRWSIQPKTDIVRHKKLIEFSYPPEDASLKDHFPEVLLRWCTLLYEKFASRVYNHPRLQRSFLAGIERYRGAKYVGFNVQERLQQAEALKYRTTDKRPSQTMTFEDQRNVLKNIKMYALKASRQSPLRRRAYEELQRMKEEHNTEIANMNAALAEAKRDLGNTRGDLGSTRDELEKKKQDHETYRAASESQIATLQKKVADLRDEISHQNEKIAVARSDLLSSRKERDSEKEISQHQSQSHVENFRRIKFVYTSSMRHAHAHGEQNKWIVDSLRKTIDYMATDFEYLKEVTQGSDLHQTYQELYDECKRLLTLTPPKSPTSADHIEPLK